MTRRKLVAPFAVLTGTIAAAYVSAASAQVSVSDDFTQANDSNNWKTYNGACLTAGDGTGAIPACVGLPYYGSQTLVGGNSGKLPDPAGSGALRFTNGSPGGYNQAGGIISNFTFPTGAGLQVTFKTVTYRGDSGGAGKDGADGISFFLMDGSLAPYDTGAFGGSLGYTCSNANNDSTKRADGTTRGFDGLRGGYLGLGIDEYGNFLNGTTNTLGEKGTSASGDNTASGGGYQPGRVGLRGAGSVSWAGLNALDNVAYPTTGLTLAQQQAAVQNTCKTGFKWDYSNPSKPKQTTTAVADYAAIPGAYKVLSGVTIANESAQKRPDAAPITYSLKITQDGLLSLSYSYNGGAYQPVISKQNITTSNGALPASFRFGFNGSTGGSTNIHEIMCFQASPADLAATSVGVNEKEATKIATGTQAYLAYYYPTTWTGRLTASNLLYDPSSLTISVASTANWDAQCNLTGIPLSQSCPTTQVAGKVDPQAPTSRSILTWTNNAPASFEWASLSSADQNTLDAGDQTPINSNRLLYLRGDRTNEINSAGVGLFRAREGVLGDIVDSSPTWVGPPKSPYPSLWKDLLNPTAVMVENSGSQSYGQYLSAAGGRLNVVYAGSNDGMVHGSRSGSYDSNGNYVNNATTPNDGQEVLAYVPGAVLQTIHNSTDSTLDYANSQYAHNWFVDATPGTDDLYYNNVWHTWLVGGLGAGGAAIYALDVTDPTQFSEKKPASLVMGEWTSSTISCANASSCGQSMGNTYGVPVIRRLHNGQWAIIFGNGYGSSTGDAGIFIITLSSTDGTVQNIYYLSTGSSSDGIGYVSPADLDGDHITDYVYAGDLLGNVWRFDLTSTNPSLWAAGSAPLFTVPGGQPITTKLQLAIVPQNSGLPRLMVDFGTGRKIPQTTTNAAQYMASAGNLYGIWDWNMGAWNAKSSAAGQLTSLPAPQSLTVSVLQSQALTTPVAGVRDVTSNPVCWAGSSTCSSGNNQFGWTIALPGAAEQVIFSPLMYQSAFLVNTTIPASYSTTSCTTATDTGYTMAVSVATGGVLTGFYKNYNDTSATGSQTNGSGTPFVVLVAGNAYMMTQTLGGGAGGGDPKKAPIVCKPGDRVCETSLKNAGATGRRVTWIERR
jgi:type IV pilus assembly protein PilY1